jgi:methylated-DNA-[protein]-cysteine S-methyltransferase
VSVTCLRYEADGWGVGELWTDRRRVLWHELPRPAANGGPDRTLGGRRGAAYEYPDPHPGWGADPPPTAKTLPDDSARRRADFGSNVVALLRRYFAGEEVDFTHVALDLDELTPFGRRLARALAAVPRGEVVTYGELAALAGRPGAARAAGTFCARNRLCVFVPCHRVVAADGLGGYGSLGASYKRRLLELEGAMLDPARPPRSTLRTARVAGASSSAALRGLAETTSGGRLDASR